jgi:hypothetical protein
MKTKLIVIALASIFAFVLVAQQRNVQERQAGPEGPDPSIISKLSEIVNIREGLAKSYELMLGAGRAPAYDSTEIELAEARIELAREQGQSDGIINELKGLVATHERLMKRVEAVAAQGSGSAGDVDRARAALLEAEVRLLRAQK